MVRALMPLWSVLFLVPFGWQVAATPPSEAGVTAPAVSCEQPTTSTAVPPPKLEADVVSIMNRWIADKEAISQMETWWRERSKQPDALEGKPVPRATRETISQMQTWWQQRSEVQPAKTARPQRPHRHQRHYAASATEFGCPPSLCSKASSAVPNATPYTTPYDQTQWQYQQAEEQYRRAEELYQRQLELLRGGKGDYWK